MSLMKYFFSVMVVPPMERSHQRDHSPGFDEGALILTSLLEGFLHRPPKFQLQCHFHRPGPNMVPVTMVPMPCRCGTWGHGIRTRCLPRIDAW